MSLGLRSRLSLRQIAARPTQRKGRATSSGAFLLARLSKRALFFARPAK
jgi:hypothetical protein